MRMTSYAAIAVIIMALIGGIGYQQYRIQGLQLDAAKAAKQQAEDYADQLRQIADREHQSAQAMADIARDTQHDIAEIKTRTDRIPAAIRAGNLRLREYWQASLPASAASAGQLDATEQRRAESASRIVRAAESCDAQVRGLQRVIRDDRKDRKAHV